MCNTCRNVRQIARVEKRASSQNWRADIAQRVGTGLRPGKLRKKALGEDNKDGELARGIGEVGRIVDTSSGSV